MHISAGKAMTRKKVSAQSSARFYARQHRKLSTNQHFHACVNPASENLSQQLMPQMSTLSPWTKIDRK